MSVVEETGDAGSTSSPNGLAHEAPSSRSSSQQDADPGEGSESESYVEVEHLGDDSAPGPANFATVPAATSSPPSSVVRHITKRTLITIQQRSILEEFYRNGMSSASLQLAHMHDAAAERTGLDLSVVRNWIRNRRRPNAAKSAEKMAEKIAAYASTASQVPPTLIPSTLTPLTTLPHTVVVTTTNPPHHTAPGLIRVGDGAPSAQTIQYNSIPHIGVPEPKRLCLDHNSQNSHPHPTQPSPSPSSTSQPPLVVKVRLCGSGECDFVEVEVPSVTYQALLQTCCEELEVNVTDVAKIRKLPNVLIRKDRDIQRMKEGQELEIVMKNEAVSPPSSYMTSMLTVNPFSSNAVLAIQNHVQPRSEAIMPGMTLTQGKAEENGTGNLISGLNDSSSQLSDVHSHSHSTATVNGLQ